MADQPPQDAAARPFLMAFAEPGPPPYRLEGSYDPVRQVWASPAGTVRPGRTQYATNPATVTQTNGTAGRDTNLDSGHDVDFD
jgi:hypothetical protein